MLTRVAILVVLVLLLLIAGCATPPAIEYPPLPPSAPKSSARAAIEETGPAPGPPLMAWTGDLAAWYFVNWAPFSVPDVYIVLAGPLTFTDTNMTWRMIEEGLYSVGSECPRGCR